MDTPPEYPILMLPEYPILTPMCIRCKGDCLSGHKGAHQMTTGNADGTIQDVGISKPMFCMMVMAQGDFTCEIPDVGVIVCPHWLLEAIEGSEA